ncbi:MAG TPA: hypothetical protein PK373_05895, partial [Sedimentisphaerales bacterium]|nr:hypothetical protein [Sedimentisphaerales bacterium]
MSSGCVVVGPAPVTREVERDGVTLAAGSISLVATWVLVGVGRGSGSRSRGSRELRDLDLLGVRLGLRLLSQVYLRLAAPTA